MPRSPNNRHSEQGQAIRHRDKLRKSDLRNLSIYNHVTVSPIVSPVTSPSIAVQENNDGCSAVFKALFRRC